jgi:predicted amidohydrolase
MSILKIGLGQIRISDSIEGNVKKCCDFISKAGGGKVDLISFPEGTIGGYFGSNFQSPDEVDWPAVDAGVRVVRCACKKAKVGAVLGASIRDNKSRIWNILYLVSKSGRIIGQYDKCHLTGSDKKCYKLGGVVDVYRFNRIRVGMQICYDQRFPELWRVLAIKGAKIIFHSSNACISGDTWKRPVVEAHIRSRAAENGYYVVSVNRGGPSQNWGSVIYDPCGVEVARANYDREELVTAKIDLSKVSRAFLNNRRTDLAEIVER